jgi:hypothetical protein
MIDGEVVAEAYGCQIKVSKTKESIPRCGAFFEGNKVMGAKITGSVQLYNATSRLIQLEASNLKAGKDTRVTLISTLDDPDNPNPQRIQATGVSFDDVTLADWEAAKTGTITAPFTADDYDILES